MSKVRVRRLVSSNSKADKEVIGVQEAKECTNSKILQVVVHPDDEIDILVVYEAY